MSLLQTKLIFCVQQYTANSSNFRASVFLKHFDLYIQYSWCSVYCWLLHPHYAIFLFKWLAETSDLEQSDRCFTVALRSG